MRPPPLGEEEVPKLTKEKKRKRASPPDTPKPRNSRAQKSKTDSVVLSADVVQHLREEDEEGDGFDCLLVARKRGSTEASKTAEPVVVEEVQSQTEEISEDGRVESPSLQALQREENVPSDSLATINIEDSPPGHTFSKGQFQDARAMDTPDVGTTHKGNDIFHGCFAGVDDGPDLDASLIFDEAQRLLNQAKALHREASSKYRAELIGCEAELKKLTEERDGLTLLYVQKEEKIRSLRAELARAHKDQTELIEGLYEEAKIKEADTLGWKQNMDCLASEKDAVRAQLSLVEHHLQSVKEESSAKAQKIEELEAKLVAELAKAKSEAEALVASYRADAEAANIRAQKISVAIEVKLSCAVDHARRESRRETLEEVHARGFNLSADIESAKVLEDKFTAFLLLCFFFVFCPL
ncbi:uncharacterized protein [Nicotiana tomentosiformis]|uniref:uncharacterized protein n=1 Tax=Nicotiana tomentosiformis TaxID=4098 RepID=UPI00388CA4D8